MLKSSVFHIFLIIFVLIEGKSISQPLDYFIAQGLQNSPLLKDFRNQLNSAALDSLLVKASLKPQAGITSQFMYAPYFDNFGYDEAITNGGNFSTLFGISQYLFNRKAIKYKYESISVQKQSISASLKISENDLKRIITNQYLAAYATYSDLKFNESFMKLMNEEKDIIKRLAEQGIYKPSDYLSFVIEAQTGDMQLLQLNIQYDKDIRLLCELCGMSDTTHFVLSLPEINKLNTVAPSFSPLFQQFKIDSIKIIYQKKTLDIDYLPKFNWFADAGFLSSTPENIYRHFGISAGINFSVPIYDGRQRKLNYQKFEILEKTRAGYSNFYKRQYDQQILQFSNELVNTTAMLNKLKEQSKTAGELITETKTQLNNGNISILELINAFKNYYGINRNFNQAQIKKLQVINEMNYLLQQ